MNEALKDMLTQDAIIAKQDMESSNIILGIDAANRYLLFGPNGQSLGIAAEESSGAGSWLIRQFLRNKRPCKVHIYDQKGQQIATGKKPFRFIFSEMSALLDGQIVGRSRRRFKILKRKYTIEVQGGSIFEINSGIFQIGKHTFDVTRNNSVVATIAKQFEGMMKMAFTQADTFSIFFKDNNLTLQERCTLLFTLFLIDFDVFEQR